MPDMDVSRLSFISFFLFSASRSSSACSAFRFSLRSTFIFLALACCAAFMRAVAPLGSSSSLVSDSSEEFSASSPSVSESDESVFEGSCNFYSAHISGISNSLRKE